MCNKKIIDAKDILEIQKTQDLKDYFSLSKDLKLIRDSRTEAPFEIVSLTPEEKAKQIKDLEINLLLHYAIWGKDE